MLEFLNASEPVPFVWDIYTWHERSQMRVALVSPFATLAVPWCSRAHILSHSRRICAIKLHIGCDSRKCSSSNLAARNCVIRLTSFKRLHGPAQIRLAPLDKVRTVTGVGQPSGSEQLAFSSHPQYTGHALVNKVLSPAFGISLRLPLSATSTFRSHASPV